LKNPPQKKRRQVMAWGNERAGSRFIIEGRCFDEEESTQEGGMLGKGVTIHLIPGKALQKRKRGECKTPLKKGEGGTSSRREGERFASEKGAKLKDGEETSLVRKGLFYAGGES